MKQALSYVGEHMNNGIFEIRIYKECLNFNNQKLFIQLYNLDILDRRNITYTLNVNSYT